jgi:methylated-DNA-[protein]-cysteine S-methyltransferase
MAGRTRRAAPGPGSPVPVSRAVYISPIGPLEIIGTEAGIRLVEFADGRTAPGDPPAPCLEECLRQLDGYFRGTRREFSVGLDLEGTPFQRSCWNELLKVPFGRTTTYRDLAVALKKPGATRAVGGANHRNPVSIFVPCHRVIGADGSLTGYGGGLWRKEWLLAHERR